MPAATDEEFDAGVGPAGRLASDGFLSGKWDLDNQGRHPVMSSEPAYDL
jgi:hypothetical protein